MSLNSTPSANRLHIGFFGCRNAGKSSLVNAVTNQALSVVSDTAGTTTDPVLKTMELLPLGPVVIIDTPGYDDSGELGELRVAKTRQILNKTDIAVLVIDAVRGIQPQDRELISIFKDKKIPYVVAYNKSDLTKAKAGGKVDFSENGIYVSAQSGFNVGVLKEKIAATVPKEEPKPLVSDLLTPGSVAVLVTPIDEAAPKGRLILPQQQVLRDILDSGSIGVVTREFELEKTLASLKNQPAIVITDSQAFKYVSERVPESVPLTSFSILMARYKGFLSAALDSVNAIENLKDGDTVLIAEGCTHHRQCNDIGTVKIPRWLKEYTGKNVKIETCSGTEYPLDLSKYAVVIHCGGCMLNEREMVYRMKCTLDAGVPFINYGIFIAYITGILERSVTVFKK